MSSQVKWTREENFEKVKTGAEIGSSSNGSARNRQEVGGGGGGRLSQLAGNLQESATILGYPACERREEASQGEGETIQRSTRAAEPTTVATGGAFRWRRGVPVTLTSGATSTNELPDASVTTAHGSGDGGSGGFFHSAKNLFRQYLPSGQRSSFKLNHTLLLRARLGRLDDKRGENSEQLVQLSETDEEEEGDDEKVNFVTKLQQQQLANESDRNNNNNNNADKEADCEPGGREADQLSGRSEPRTERDKRAIRDNKSRGRERLDAVESDQRRRVVGFAFAEFASREENSRTRNNTRPRHEQVVAARIESLSALKTRDLANARLLLTNTKCKSTTKDCAPRDNCEPTGEVSCKQISARKWRKSFLHLKKGSATCRKLIQERKFKDSNNNELHCEQSASEMFMNLSLANKWARRGFATSVSHQDQSNMSSIDSNRRRIKRNEMPKRSLTKSQIGGAGDKVSLLATATATTTTCYYLTLALILSLVASLTLGPKLALGQHQQSPFARSQPTGGVRELGGPLPPARTLSPAQLPPLAAQQSNSQQHQPQPQQQQHQQQQQPTPLPATGSLVANINCNKIRGHVTLTPNLQGGTTVTTQISAGPPGEVYQWSIHQFPIKPGAAMCSCSPLILGSKLVDLSDLHGNLPSDQEFSVQSNLALFGSESPVGHSLLLRGLKTGMVACGTFLPTSRKSNYRAKFHTPLSGSVTVFQTAFGTSFLSHLMYSNGTRRHSMHRFDILRSDDDIITTSLLASGQQPQSPGANMPAASNLAQLEQREHENELAACRRFSSGEPLFRNLTYQLAVSTENFGMRGRTALVLPQIPFETFSSVYVVIYSELDPQEPIACAPLRFVKPKTAAAKFQTHSVQGQVVFSQDSPYDVTVARVNMQFPNSDGHSYGIDELPMIIRRKSDTRVCPNIREIIYNPHHIEPSSVPPEGEATSDQYAVGDLSGKYGSLTGKASEKITVSDHNLPLFGPVSIVGRALTVYSADGIAIACSNVELTSPMTTAFATFDYGIQGQFIFRQQMNDCNGDTYVYIEVSKPTTSSSSTANHHQQQQQQSAVASLASSGSDHFGQHHNHQQTNGRSLDHNWHIHAQPVDSGLEHLSTTECAAAGGHFNPYNTSTSTIYSRDCTPFNVLRCELGDLASKMFTIEIPPYKVKSGGQEPDIGKFFGTDIDLPLCGPVSIVNRSVVVHTADFGAQRLACSTVIEFKPRV